MRWRDKTKQVSELTERNGSVPFPDVQPSCILPRLRFLQPQNDADLLKLTGEELLVRDMDYQNAQIAEIYEIINSWGRDLEFYLALAGDQPLSILDLGCGTGTLCCALAARGHRVTGVDPAAAMLAIARRKAHAEKVEWIESSAQDYKSPRRFDLIVMTGNAFQILLTDVETLAVLSTMSAHLKQGGRIAFETRNPGVDWAGEWSSRAPLVRMSTDGQVVETLDVTSKDAEFVSFDTSYRLPHGTLVTRSRLRFPSCEHVEALIARSGLVVRNLFGDWDATRFEAARSREMIFIAELAGRQPSSHRRF